MTTTIIIKLQLPLLLLLFLLLQRLNYCHFATATVLQPLVDVSKSQKATSKSACYSVKQTVKYAKRKKK